MSSRNIECIRPSRIVTVPVKGTTHIRPGEIVFRITATGYCIPMDVDTGRTCVGIAIEEADNDPGADGAINVKCQQGDFIVKNAGTNTVARINVGATAYGETAETSSVEGAVGTDSTGKSPVGTILDVFTTGETGVKVRIES